MGSQLHSTALWHIAVCCRIQSPVHVVATSSEPNCSMEAFSYQVTKWISDCLMVHNDDLSNRWPVPTNVSPQFRITPLKGFVILF